MKRIAFFLTIFIAFNGCTPPKKEVPQEQPYIPPLYSYGFDTNSANVLSFPIELSDELLDNRGDYVWQYHYTSPNSQNYMRRVDLVMHCNHAVDFDFINYPMVFFITQHSPLLYINTLCELAKETSTRLWYHCSWQDCNHRTNDDLQYNYEIVFPILFPQEGTYHEIEIGMYSHMSSKEGLTQYSYHTPHIIIQTQNDISQNRDGGTVSISIVK